MPTPLLIPANNFYDYNFFYLNYYHESDKTKILAKFEAPHLNTKNIPQTLKLLKRYLPSILYSRCYNPENLTFKKEVIQTEIGHLLEHIILEYLAEESFSKYKIRQIFKGITTWNWDKEEKGIFRIEITASTKDIDIFLNSLKKSTLLLEKILLSN